MDCSPQQKSPLSARYWGEETTPGGIWAIYLKKVRYHPCSSYSVAGSGGSSQDGDDTVSHLEWETVKIRYLKAGTLEVIVASLSDDQGEVDPNVMHILLSTYRSFATCGQLLKVITTRYQEIDEGTIQVLEDTEEGHKIALRQTLAEWVDKYPEDFFSPPDHEELLALQEFVKKYAPSSIIERKVQGRLKELRSKKGGKFFEPKSWINEYSRDQMKIGLQFEDIDNKHFALQLTWMDMTLFRRLVPYHCLTMRSRKTGDRCGETYQDTVRQFNAVVKKVISTVLIGGTEVKVSQRAEILTKWIEIADELRYVKNFTSLKAIIAALQSNDLYRLSRVWQSVAREKTQRFSELAAIFSEDNNEMNARSLLLKEGTAKTADWKPDRSTSSGNKSPRHNGHKHTNHFAQSQPTISGTIPYLGTFMKDLTMTDSAYPENVTHPDGTPLINFDKKKKEFEILAQIKILQSSSNSYSIQPDPAFLVWFDSIEILREDESYELSCEIEPANPVIRDLNSISRVDGLRRCTSVNDAINLGHRKKNSTSSTTSSSSCVLLSQDLQSTSDVSSMASLPRGEGICVVDSNGLSSLSDSRLSHSTCSLQLPRITTTGQLRVTGARNPEVHIARVSVAQPGVTPQQGQNLYKSIFLSNRERTQQVIKNSLEKFAINDDPGNYMLVQQGPDGQEIEIPPDTNVYYAVNKSYELNFVLKHRSLQRPAVPSLLKYKSSSMSLLLRRKF
ncbi:ral guanine nucleotide dissociation stimulator-like 1 isoform X1 [Varroa jacobsoni]|uniref:Ral guanine nucleotide dissociation stimulator-like 1 n=1 Tax=Varroa destructor TaxID=109461 RepID=A0A7M7M878_VARDE|nr:ral guanine nucleotide dissociation stimulator-like 1 isoform X3 [Varroa destructor]XP_022656939.1 ral guanine nucleotide dissociation stimulator-like 1 isoform X3 [Varroa destructor]XP_022656946.1 ral guanine nucleotide dissociation stimulator-like 1 isoform X3 [Varroa destructor]XP_022689591.1 ral guanine nucleotide dissociation stimulator-like 1 isoform X1 [Varroa jacobsoni]XP_022689592.1 ral guanine nucleotide dissociation stimulator-like 1 isoform X1 [Varroa jacobsoni]